MTEIDARKAARQQALVEYQHSVVRDRYDADLLVSGFIDGAQWAVDQLPSRDDLFDVVHDAIPELGIQHASMDGLYAEIACNAADAVLALIRSRYEENECHE